MFKFLFYLYSIVALCSVLYVLNLHSIPYCFMILLGWCVLFFGGGDREGVVGRGRFQSTPIVIYIYIQIYQ